MKNTFNFQKSFLGFIAEEYGQKTVAATKTAFERLGLPLPKMRDMDFRVTSDNGLMVFLTVFGCTIRMMDKKLPIPDDDHVLQPIGSIDLGGMYLHLFPGINVGTTQDYHQKLIEKFDRSQLEYFDRGLDNAGSLISKTKKFPEGQVVIIDPPAVRIRKAFLEKANLIKEACKGAKRSFPKIEEKPSQERLFSGLRHSFEQGYLSGDMDDFWKLCKEMKERRILSSSWTAIYQRNIDEIAENYDSRIKQYRPELIPV